MIFNNMNLDDLLEFNLDFDENFYDAGTSALSFVLDPATKMTWRTFNSDETYNDYPKAATNNACRALKYKKENDISCGTNVGWARANQLCNRENISRDTIARMASFKRHQQHKDVPYDEGCGGIMYDAWGGEEGIEWAIRKMKSFNNFNNQEFKEIDYEKRMVTSVVMLADTKILRYSDTIGHYTVKFRPETIEKMVKKYFKEGKIHKVNLSHNQNMYLDSVFMVESYIVDDRNKSNLFPNVPHGTWIATFSIEDEELWKDIKNGDYTGVSLEGLFVEYLEDDIVNKAINDINNIINSDESEDVKYDKLQKLLNIR